jgi:hypothetical protein
VTATPTCTLTDIEAAIRAAWNVDTCDPVDVPDWRPDNPSRGQCGVTALVLHDLLGGDLLLAEIHHADGTRQGVHYWNRLPNGLEIDLTRAQFQNAETISPPRTAPRPPGPPRRARAQYDLLRRRVHEALHQPTP